MCYSSTDEIKCAVENIPNTNNIHSEESSRFDIEVQNNDDIYPGESLISDIEVQNKDKEILYQNNNIDDASKDACSHVTNYDISSWNQA